MYVCVKGLHFVFLFSFREGLKATRLGFCYHNIFLFSGGPSLYLGCGTTEIKFFFFLDNRGCTKSHLTLMVR